MMPAHFNDESWADYVRGIVSGAETAAIEDHLRKQCEICLQSFRIWRRVADSASGEVRINVPQQNVETGRAAYPHWWRRYSLPKRARIARLIFDSLLQPLPAGIRGASPSSRRMIARLGLWSVDLRFEAMSERQGVVTGQVLRSGKTSANGLNALVVVMTGGALLTETMANQFGEFEMQLNRTSGLELYVEIAGRRPIGVILPDLAASSTGGGYGTGPIFDL